MKKLFSLIAILVLGTAAPAAAQDYSGPDLTQGVFDAPAAIEGGSVVTFTASDLLPGAPVDVVLIAADGSITVLDSASVQGATLTRLARIDVAGDGSVSINVRIPADLADGSYTLEVRSTKADGTPFLSTVSFTRGQGISGSNVLARTGASSTNYVQFAGLSLLFGFGLLFVSQRNRETVPVKIDG